MKKKIAIIGGGNMGGAIAESLVGSEYDVAVTARSEETLSRLRERCPGFLVTTDNTKAATAADIVVLAVKPWLLAEVAEEMRYFHKPDAIVVSVVATVSTSDLKEMVGRSHPVFRVIPNTAIRLRKSATFIAPAPDAGEKALKVVEEIFRLSGKTFVVAEKDMAAVTALSSCGIAYFLRFMRAATEGGVELGLRARFSAEVAAATAEGAAALVADGGHPELEIDKVTTPGGITIKGLNALEAHGFTSAVIAAIMASFKP